MSYATVEDYIAFVGEQEALEQSNLDNPNSSSINREILLRWLNAASAEIDGHLAVRYAVPIAPPVPAMLSEIACVIARKNLDRYMRREHVQQDYKDAIERLKRLAKGQELLTGQDGAELEEPESSRAFGQVSYGSGYRVFSRSSLSNYGRGWLGD